MKTGQTRIVWTNWRSGLLWGSSFGEDLSGHRNSPHTWILSLIYYSNWQRWLAIFRRSRTSRVWRVLGFLLVWSRVLNTGDATAEFGGWRRVHWQQMPVRSLPALICDNNDSAACTRFPTETAGKGNMTCRGMRTRSQIGTKRDNPKPNAVRCANTCNPCGTCHLQPHQQERVDPNRYHCIIIFKRFIDGKPLSLNVHHPCCGPTSKNNHRREMSTCTI